MSHYFKKETVISGNSISNAWNLLPDHIATSLTVACFKHRPAKLNFTRCSAVFNLLGHLLVPNLILRVDSAVFNLLS